MLRFIERALLSAPFVQREIARQIMSESARELQETRDKYEELVNTIDGVVWEAELGKSPYTFVSSQVERLFGYSIDRWLSEQGFWRSILHSEDRSKLYDAFQKSAEIRDHRKIEYRLIAADGRVLWVRDYVTLIPASRGAPAKMRGIMVDITELKSTHASLVMAKAAAESANRMKSLFLANMSHEIRTPLNAILGMTSLILESKLSKGLRESLQTVKVAGDSLLALINDILDYSKIEAGKLELEILDFDVRSLVRSAVEISELQAERKGIKISTALDERLPGFVRGDSGRLLQILLNLMNNAIKFTEHGRVEVRVSSPSGGASSGGASSEEARLRFEVSDTGMGMSPSTVAKLFHPFTQADDSTTRRFGGTGLGLSISKKLIELMGGDIDVTSAEGIGTTFSFELALPLGSSEAAEKSVLLDPAGPVPLPKTALQAKRILVAEDNVANQKVILRFLHRLGARADTVANGEEAVHSYVQRRYDLVLMDCQMPEMDGYAATGRIRELERERRLGRVPIIALTAHAFASDRQRCIDAGMDDYVSKPFDFMRLQETLRRWLLRGPAPGSLPSPGPGSGDDEIPAGELVDLKHIDDLRSLNEPGQPDLFREILQIFLETGPGRIEELRGLLASGDLEGMSKVAHAFKSTCFSAGAKQIGELCREIEKGAAGSGRKRSSLKRQVEVLPALFRRTSERLQELGGAGHA